MMQFTGRFKTFNAPRVADGMNVDMDQAPRTSKHLLLVGGLLAIILSPALFLLQTPLEDIELRNLTGVVTTVVLAILLIAGGAYMRKSPLSATLLAFVASIALLALGGTAGLIGGLFGIVGAVAGATPIVWDFLTRAK